MDFKTATDRLTTCVSHADIAKTARVSVQSIRQARLDSGNSNYRSPPADWQRAVVRLARERSRQLKALIDELERA